MHELKRKTYVLAVLGLLLFNCVIFTSGAMAAFSAGDPDVENAAALILIPAFFVPAAWVTTVLIGLLSALFGVCAGRGAKIRPDEIFRMSGLSPFWKLWRAAFLIFCAGAMLFGYLLLTPFHVRAVLYALSGGALLIMLYSLAKAAVCPRGDNL